tara:strand:- start:4484 stop:5059 length:576 start_codon:yes stop_codon:yes gene_type:complete
MININFFVELFLLGVVIMLLFFLFRLKRQDKEFNSNTNLIQQLKQEISELKIEVISQELEKEKSENVSKIRKQFLEDERTHSKHIEKQLEETEQKLTEEIEQRKKVLSQKKSGEVRLGNIAETLAPFLDQFKFDPENCIFLGRPIDYISFDDEQITFIEIKMGKSQLSSKQRHIRDLINDKQVYWKEIRIN